MDANTKDTSTHEQEESKTSSMEVGNVEAMDVDEEAAGETLFSGVAAVDTLSDTETVSDHLVNSTHLTSQHGTTDSDVVVANEVHDHEVASEVAFTDGLDDLQALENRLEEDPDFGNGGESNEEDEVGAPSVTVTDQQIIEDQARTIRELSAIIAEQTNAALLSTMTTQQIIEDQARTIRELRAVIAEQTNAAIIGQQANTPQVDSQEADTQQVTTQQVSVTSTRPDGRWSAINESLSFRTITPTSTSTRSRRRRTRLNPDAAGTTEPGANLTNMGELLRGPDLPPARQSTPPKYGQKIGKLGTSQDVDARKRETEAATANPASMFGTFQPNTGIPPGILPKGTKTTTPSTPPPAQPSSAGRKKTKKYPHGYELYEADERAALLENSKTEEWKNASQKERVAMHHAWLAAHGRAHVVRSWEGLRQQLMKMNRGE